jgi:hypothetical protein
MKLAPLSAAAALAAAALLPLAGCTENDLHDHYRDRERVVYPEEPVVVREERVVIVDAPPRDRDERRGVAPSANHIYVKGHWVRRGRDWDWEPGHWVARPHRGAEWVEGHWDKEGRGYVWHEGHWR